MALKPLELVKFNAIVSTVSALRLANLPLEAIKGAVAGQVTDFEGSSPYRVKIHEAAQEDGAFVTYTDTRKDFIRARQSGEAFQTLRAKIFGIPVDIKAAKEGEYEFTNAQIAEALEELAERIRALPREIKNAGNDDFKPASALPVAGGEAPESEIEEDEEIEDVAPNADGHDQDEEEEEAEEEEPAF